MTARKNSEPPRGRGRRPAAEVRERVLSTAGELLFTEGLAAVTFDKVAKGAGASRMTLYKWWPTPGALAADAYFEASAGRLVFTDTGDLRADLRRQMHRFAAFLHDDRRGRPAGMVIGELFGAAQNDPHLAEALHRSYSVPRRELAEEIFDAAAARGDLRPGLDHTKLVDQLWGACYHRVMFFGETVDAAYVDGLIDNLLDGARPAGQDG